MNEKPEGRGPLPLMKTIQDAEEWVRKTGDPFYLHAFAIEAWLGDVVLAAGEEYAGKKSGSERAMQTGQAWTGFQRCFDTGDDSLVVKLAGSLVHFSGYDDAQATLLRQAIVGLWLEGETFGAWLGSRGAGASANLQEFAAAARRSLQRWCEWIDAVVHDCTHSAHRLLPAGLDPDPEKRELATLGLLQRAFPDLSPFDREWWEWHHREAAERFRASPKWAVVGQMAAAPLRDPPNPVDDVIIALWPLAQRHRWTYRDLMRVAQAAFPSGPRYPLVREQDPASYVANVLGLKKRGKPAGRSSPHGRPPGYAVAMRLLGREVPPGVS